MHIFLSYGHDRFSPLAEKLKKDLEKDGHTVWFDKKNLRGSSEWEMEIESGIMSSDWIILMMTDHSVRRPNGVCLDEVSKARFENKKILPLMVQTVVPPFCITRVQWIDMISSYFNGEGRLNKAVYEARLQEIKDIISGIRSLGNEGEQVALLRALEPLDNDVYYSSYRKDFYGRVWLLDIYKKWVSDIDSSKVFVILGKAGTGKTAFVASLCSRQPEVAGIHFCRYNDSDRANPKKALTSLAYSMSTQIPEYADELRKANLADIQNKSIGAMFQTLFTSPLSKVSREEPMVLIIDALDESDVNGRNDLLEIIATEFEKTPRWLKLLITSRPETNISSIVSRYHPLIVEEQAQNLEDVRGYAEQMLSGMDLEDKDGIIGKLVKRSQGNFLYMTQTVKGILDGSVDPYDPDSYPEGLNGIFMINFNRLFEKDIDFYKRNVRPFLEILVSEFEPIPADEIFDMTDVDEYDREDVIGRISPLFPMREGIVTPMHKSIYDWLIDKNASYPYMVLQKKGHERLASYFDTKIAPGRIDRRAAKFAIRHNILCGRIERAAELIDNRELQEVRFSMLGVDSTAYEYFRDLESVNEADPNKALEIMKGETFLWILDTLHDHIMHMGMFPVMMRCGFDSIADGVANSGKWSRMQFVGLYYYNTARTKTAIGYFERIGEEMPEGNDDVLSGTMDMLGLSYKKYIRFDESEKCLKRSVDIAPNRRVGASSMVNLSKIYYHELRWEDAYRWVTEGIEELQRYIDSMEDQDEKESSIRFKAEFYRIKAEVAMWNMDAETCDECYRQSEAIHSMFDMRDQYQPRYEYTKLFVSLIKGQPISRRAYESGMAMECNSYDKERFMFYYGLYLYATGDAEGALELFDECHRICVDTDFIMECTELESAMELCGRPKCSYENGHLTVWADYTRELFQRIRDGYRE